MAGTENFQIVEAKHKKIVVILSENKAELQLSKKVKGKQLKKYYINTAVKMRSPAGTWWRARIDVWSNQQELEPQSI